MIYNTLHVHLFIKAVWTDYTRDLVSNCMRRIKRLWRKEVSRYKTSDLWTWEEGEVFLKYCPSKRDKAYLFMVLDTSFRLSELLNLHLISVTPKKHIEYISPLKS